MDVSLFVRRGDVGVVVESQCIEGDGYSYLGLRRAFETVVNRRLAYPVELRAAPPLVADFGADLVALLAAQGRPVPAPVDWSSLQFNGVPLVVEPCAPPMVLLAVFREPELGVPEEHES